MPVAIATFNIHTIVTANASHFSQHGGIQQHRCHDIQAGHLADYSDMDDCSIAQAGETIPRFISTPWAVNHTTVFCQIITDF